MVVRERLERAVVIHFVAVVHFVLIIRQVYQFIVECIGIVTIMIMVRYSLCLSSSLRQYYSNADKIVDANSIRLPTRVPFLMLDSRFATDRWHRLDIDPTLDSIHSMGVHERL